MDHEDQKYIDALLNDDKILSREIYIRFYDKIKRMVLQHGGNESDTADIFQEALLAIINRARKRAFILTCPFEALLYLICVRKWRKELKKRGKLRVTNGDKETFDIKDPASKLADECMLFEERKSLLVKIVDQMGGKCKELLYLSWEDISMEELASKLDISYGYARKRKSECMAKLINLIHQSPEYSSLKS